MPAFRDVIERYDGRVGRFTQGRLIRRARVFDPNGICGALALKWIRHKHERTNFLRAVRSEEGLDDLRYIARLRRTERDYAKAYLEEYDLRQQYRHIWRGEVSINELTDMATAGAGYYLVGLTDSGIGPAGQDISGHALAIDMFSCAFFDPNGGQAKFDDDDDLKKAFKFWFRAAYPDLRGRAFLERYL